MISKLKIWWAKQGRAASRSRNIRLTVDIPYSEHNEVVLRGLTIGAVELKLHDAVGTQVVPDLENVIVRCTANPNWRS